MKLGRVSWLPLDYFIIRDASPVVWERGENTQSAAFTMRDATQHTCSGCLAASIEQRTTVRPSLPGYSPKTHCSYSVTMAYYCVSLDTNYLADFQTEKT